MTECVINIPSQGR